jgi:hypothetical protein
MVYGDMMMASVSGMAHAWTATGDIGFLT